MRREREHYLGQVGRLLDHFPSVIADLHIFVVPADVLLRYQLGNVSLHIGLWTEGQIIAQGFGLLTQEDIHIAVGSVNKAPIEEESTEGTDGSHTQGVPQGQFCLDGPAPHPSSSRIT